ncbi:hypothetical protein VFPPC_17649 [Pochonia chlamydosporia 170]|uniref:Uncharacterized protein n=1 Tax=Pochonia chlamydosporia 170 TaxID=1380566 RepID=A0A219ASI1_METCM|nr:hypothetical protein VFPPC_17649 [Pochonia chlamydosporia 170]OWT43175.1 hypothetical protein VFPPC_17649 [Pochonia chlamydosporia 170]
MRSRVLTWLHAQGTLSSTDFRRLVQNHDAIRDGRGFGNPAARYCFIFESAARLLYSHAPLLLNITDQETRVSNVPSCWLRGNGADSTRERRRAGRQHAKMWDPRQQKLQKGEKRYMNHVSGLLRIFMLGEQGNQEISR